MTDEKRQEADPDNECIDEVSELFKDGMMRLRMVFEQLYNDCIASGVKARNGIMMSFEDGSMIAFSKNEKLTREIRKTYDRVLAADIAEEFGDGSCGWVFMLHEQDEMVFVAPLRYWEENGCILDRHVAEGYDPEENLDDEDYDFEESETRIDFPCPKGWIEVMDSCFQYNGKKKFDYWPGFARKAFCSKGFKEVLYEDGEVTRLKKFRDIMAADDELEQDEIDDINKRIQDLENEQ